MKSRNISKTIGINLLVLLCLLATLEFMSMVYLDLKLLTKKAAEDPRSQALNYADKPWASTHFRERKKSSAVYRSYFGWKKKPFKGETINIDSAGHRKTTQLRSEGMKQPLVVFLGGSTMYGDGSRDHETIPSQFVTLSNGEYKAINMGEGAFSAFQSYIYFQIQISKGAAIPDIVVSYDGVNNCGFGRDHFGHPREVQMQQKLRGADKGKYHFMNHTKTVINSFKVKKGKEANGTNSVEGQKKAAIELLESWLLMKYLCDRIGAEFMCILQPVAFLGEPNLEHEPVLKEERRAYYDYYYSFVRELLEEEKYMALQNHFVDMSAAFDHIPLLYIDHSHTSPRGNAIIAKKVLKELTLRSPS